MKKLLVRIAIAAAIASVIIFVLSYVAIANARKNIDYTFDEELFLRAKNDQTVYYYAYDRSGELTEVYKSSQSALREWTDFDDAGEYLKRGFIAMEDREFYNHNGINLKRTLAATLNYIFKSKDGFGASTITQQVIKNISGDNEESISRKLKEILRAFNLERNHTKDDIFELYLNIVPMTGKVYGVGAASEIYFGKEPHELSLAEAATIVGITNAPAKYNPYTKPDACKAKRNRVLYAMLDVGYITEEEYTAAINSPLELSEGQGNFGISSWFIETANDEILGDICTYMDVSRAAARLLLNGSRVVLTMNPEIQEILDEYFSNTDNLSEKFKDGLNYSMAVSDPYTSDLLGVIGNGGEKRSELLFNYATSNVTPGSVLKPLALYAPLIDKDEISWSSIFDDAPIEYRKDGEEEIPYPRNSPDVYDGLIDINDALKRSKNTVAIRLFSLLGAENIFKHLKYDYGFDTLIEKERGSNGEIITDLGAAPLALGQLSYGVSLRGLTEAYNVFPSEGILSRGRSYSIVYSRDGDILIEKKAEGKRLYSEETAQLMNQLLSNVVNDGTARRITLKEIVDVAGKTGTSGNDKDRLFIGYTPYYTAGIWCGFARGDASVGFNTPSHLEIWDKVMTRIHEKMVFNGYEENIGGFNTDKLVIAPYCSISGLAPKEECGLDDGATVKLGYYKASDELDGCDCH